MRKNRGVKRCPECGAKAYVTSWRPAGGLDPQLREFICSALKHKFYVAIEDPELLKYYEELFRKV